MVDEVTVTTIQELIDKVEETYGSWKTKAHPWFRGEPRVIPNNNPSLLPKLYREKHDELKLLHQFRMKAPTFVPIQIPQREFTDQWLFLARHVGLPTRLLDWTEGLLIALHFALYSSEEKDAEGAVVWMLNPLKLNKLSDEHAEEKFPPITWFSPELSATRWIRELLDPDARAQKAKRNFFALFLQKLVKGRVPYNLGNRNVRAAWEANPQLATKYPVSIQPVSIHPRITVQRGTFTIWGSDPRGLEEIIDELGDSCILRKFVIADGAIDSLKPQLHRLGISWSSLFPDLDYLAKDLENIY